MPKTTPRYTKPGSRRLLSPEEKALIRAMVANLYPELDSVLEISEVEEMLDGGMGSIRFVDEHMNQRHLGKVLREAKFMGVDGMPVLVSINLDQNGRLFEVDIWKVDFSPLRRYPDSTELTIREG